MEQAEAEMEEAIDLGTTIELADEGDEEPIEAMYEWFESEDTEVDPDDYDTWEEAVAKLQAERKRTSRRKTKLPAEDEAERGRGGRRGREDGG
jgi:hypothetical protein